MVNSSQIDRHPWNTDFKWVNKTGHFCRLSEEQADQFNRDGFIVLENVFSDEELAPVIEATDELEARTDSFLSGMDNGRASIAEKGAITFSLFAVQFSQAARSFAAHPVFAELCHDLVGPNARLYHDQAVYKKPEKPRRFPWHQDNGYTFVMPQQYLTCWVALTDATIDNGCPQVARGLHHQGTLLHRYVDPLGWEIFEDHPDVVTAPVGKGGMVVFSSLSPHLTGPNTTDSVRKAYILQYAPDGAEVLQGDPSQGPPLRRNLANDSRRQFPVLVNGVPVSPDPLP